MADPESPSWSLFRPRRRPAPPPGARVVRVEGFAGVRLSVEEADVSLAAAADRLALPRSGWSRQPFDMLAISGGAAGGAWGAGLLCGLAEAGRRPRFAIVTGVSTGALISPFAFAGPEWDARLTEAYIGGHASRMFALDRLDASFGPSLFRAESLMGLVGPFIDAELVAAVAREHALGRRLLVATTDLDRQKTCIWDMGAIASHGGDKAVALFRDVLIASSSLPGLFPPRLFEVEVEGPDGLETYQEMHVDGGVSTPLFLMPAALLRWRRLGRRLRRGRVHVLVNTVLDGEARTTTANLPTVLMRSFDTMLRYSYHQALATAAAFCAGAGLPLTVASIPAGPETASLMNFDTEAMRRSFAAGHAHAADPALWTTADDQPFDLGRLLDALRPGP